MIKTDKLILVGVVLSPHGTRGEVIVKSFTNPITNIKNLSLIDQVGNPLKIEYFKNHKNNFITKIDEVKDRNQAGSVKNLKIYCYRSNLPKLNREEFYVSDLINLEVRDINNQVIGEVVEFHDYGAGHSLEIKFKGIKNTELFLFTKKTFTAVYDDYIVFVRP